MKTFLKITIAILFLGGCQKDEQIVITPKNEYSKQSWYNTEAEKMTPYSEDIIDWSRSGLLPVMSLSTLSIRALTGLEHQAINGSLVDSIKLVPLGTQGANINGFIHHAYKATIHFKNNILKVPIDIYFIHGYGLPFTIYGPFNNSLIHSTHTNYIVRWNKGEGTKFRINYFRGVSSSYQISDWLVSGLELTNWKYLGKEQYPATNKTTNVWQFPHGN